MGTPNLLSASLTTLTGSDNATGSMSVYFSETMVEAPAIEISNYNFAPSLTIASASAGLEKPEVWFTMDEGTGTSIRSSNGLYTGSFQAGSTALSWESGSYSTGSYSIFFDQSSDYITPPNAIWPTSSDDMVTVAFWARMRGDVADDVDQTTFFEAVNGSSQRIFNLHFPWSDGTVYWDCGNSGYSYDRLTYDWDVSYKDNTQWHHWAFTKKISTGQMRIYLDGTDVANSTGNSYTFDTINTTRIGVAYNNSLPWAGNLSDFAIWDTELSASDVTTLYNDGSGSIPSAISSSNLTVLYPFQEGTSTTCYDKSGNSRDGTITNSHWAYADPTPLPQTFVKFPDDASSYIDCGQHINFCTGSSFSGFTAAAWVRFNNNPNHFDAIVSAAKAASAVWYTSAGWGLFWYNNYLYFLVQTNYNMAVASFTADVAVKQWNHVVGVWETNGDVKVYLNGVIGTTVDNWTGAMTFDANPLRIGQGPSTSYSTDATINDVKIYSSKALTQAEVTSLYNERSLSPDSDTVDLTVTGINTSQGYVLDVNDNIVSSVGGNSCVPNSASFIVAPSRGISNDSTIFKTVIPGLDRTQGDVDRKYGTISNLSAEPFTTITNTITEELVTKYVQRVYDAGTAGWCYYTKTTIDTTPDASETTPNYTGAISLHSIVQILEVY